MFLNYLKEKTKDAHSFSKIRKKNQLQLQQVEFHLLLEIFADHAIKILQKLNVLLNLKVKEGKKSLKPISIDLFSSFSEESLKVFVENVCQYTHISGITICSG